MSESVGTNEDPKELPSVDGDVPSEQDANKTDGDTKELSNISDDDVNVDSKKDASVPQMSKNQLKKLKKKEKWMATKQERRKEEKRKKKERIAARKERGEEMGPDRKKLKSNTMSNSSCKIKVAIDLSLDEYMSEKDMQSLTAQLRHCYSDNRRAANPMQLYYCGDSGKTMPRMEEIGDFKRWDVNIDTKPYDESFSKESIVYLTSESPNILSSLSEDKVYIIGGIVDHNRHKGLCHKLAEEKGIAHAQLPISEYFQMSSRKVLAVNHVYSILLKYTECNDWKKAFLNEMPQRKVADLTELTTDKKSKDNGVSEQPSIPSSKSSSNDVSVGGKDKSDISDPADSNEGEKLTTDAKTLAETDVNS